MGRGTPDPGKKRKKKANGGGRVPPKEGSSEDKRRPHKGRANGTTNYQRERKKGTHLPHGTQKEGRCTLETEIIPVCLKKGEGKTTVKKKTPMEVPPCEGLYKLHR